MELFNTHELEVAKKIIDAGLTRSSESLGFFMKEKIDPNGTNMKIPPEMVNDDFAKILKQNAHILVTEIVGDLKGICCLIFSEEEVNMLHQKALPASVTSNPAMMAEMGDAILLEVDNIIAASVITQFANVLQKKIHGDVPRLYKYNSSEMPDFASSKIFKEYYVINFHTHFISASLDFSPQFIWFFDQSFTDSIKSYAANTAHIAS
ncbi:MAG: hypothetical protein ACRCYO_09045 [Bacteroidia bacterium]